jgi:hypothetical protein
MQPEKLIYEVVSPVGRSPATTTVSSASIDLSGKKVALVPMMIRNSDVLLEALAYLLAKRFSGIQFVKLPPGEGNHGDFLDESFTGMVKEVGIDAAIVGCGC